LEEKSGKRPAPKGALVEIIQGDLPAVGNILFKLPFQALK
jgi:hypothetical protein